MVTCRSFATTVASAAFFLHTSLAESFQRNPVDYVTLITNARVGTASRLVNAQSKFDLTFSLHKDLPHKGPQDIRLALEPNNDLIPDGLAVTVLGHDGQVIASNPVDRAQQKVFKGSAFIKRQGIEGWSTAGWARIMVLKDGDDPVFDGAFSIDGDNHNIATATNYRRVKLADDPSVVLHDKRDADKTMVVWRDSDMTTHDKLSRRSDDSGSLCGSDTLEFNSNYNAASRDFSPLQTMSTHQLFGRQTMMGVPRGGDPAGNLIASIGSVDGCPTTRKVAYVGVATDCTYWSALGSEEAIKQNVLAVVSKASALYEKTFNISLAVGNLTVTKSNCSSAGKTATPWNVDCSSGFTISDRLNSFSLWRGRSRDKNAYWTLLTTCPTNNAVGLAWRGQLCRQGSVSNGGGNDTIAAANVVVHGSTEWQVFAHESGHTFGAVHDCTKDQCPVKMAAQTCCSLSSNACDAGGRFLMNPSTASSMTQFSPCSIGNICAALRGNVKSDCLTENKNVETVTESVCGNGIVERGEDCDCGGKDGCGNNKCCNPQTCKYTPNSTCDVANEDCCTNDCQIASANTVCRPSTGECDIAEKCPGNSSTCPSDQHKNDGDSCGNGLQCASGQCTSRDLQCQVAVSGRMQNNGTKACRNDCLMLCESPDYMDGQCAFYNQNFLDGTSCAGGGRCMDGQCRGSSWWKEFKDWYANNKAISVSVTVVVSLLIASVLLSCLFNCFKRQSRRRGGLRRTGMTQSSNNANMWNMYGGNWWRPQPLASTSGPIMSAAAVPAEQQAQRQSVARDMNTSPDQSGGDIDPTRLDYVLPPLPSFQLDEKGSRPRYA